LQFAFYEKEQQRIQGRIEKFSVKGDAEFGGPEAEHFFIFDNRFLFAILRIHDWICRKFSRYATLI